MGDVRAGVGIEGGRYRIFVREAGSSFLRHAASVRLEEFEGEIDKPIFEHPDVDIDDFLLTQDDSAVESVMYTDDRPRVKWMTPETQKLREEFDTALVGRINHVVSTSDDRSKASVWTGTPTDPGHYYYYDRSAEQMSRLATAYEGWPDDSRISHPSGRAAARRAGPPRYPISAARRVTARTTWPRDLVSGAGRCRTTSST